MPTFQRNTTAHLIGIEIVLSPDDAAKLTEALSDYQRLVERCVSVKGDELHDWVSNFRSNLSSALSGE